MQSSLDAREPGSRHASASSCVIALTVTHAAWSRGQQEAAA
jgi:hypothetical protein